MNAAITNRGRGPEIAGTRITVFDIMDYLKQGWHHTAIAAWLRLSSDQVLAAIDYIEQHQAEVEAEYQTILAREARGNPPEVQAKLNAIHEKYQPLWAERRKALGLEDSDGQASDDGDPG
jgi:uncharacterized protein (DUF433 family)